MSLKQRIDRLERELDPTTEDMLTVIIDLRGLRALGNGQALPVPPAKPLPLRGNEIASDVTAVFMGGTEEQHRKALARLRRQYQGDAS